MKRAHVRLGGFSPEARGGFTLVLVLFLVLLLTALVIAFLTRSMLAHQVSSSSLGEMKAGLLAETAGNVILSDLHQEIIDGSAATTPATGVTIYTPKPTGSGAVGTSTPALAGFTPTYDGTTKLETDGLNNLLKRSASGVPFYSATGNSNFSESGLSRASSVNSAANPSLDGRTIPASRWNSHYLVARASGATDSTPVAAFTAPDWIFVSRDGTNPTAWNTDLADGSFANTHYVVGRYAYAIYNEGGLLDMNAAGYPTPLTAAQVATNKNAMPLADLSQLTGSLTPAQINDLVGWRNYATAGLDSSTGAFGNVSFTAASATTWLNNFVSNPATGFYNTNGFLKVIPPPTGSSGSDQALLSRQQLISLVQSLGISPDVLTCLGTFSRALEQPSYSPDPNRPRIINSGTPPPAATSADSYMGNNDGAGGDDQINPPFLSVRVTQSFTRLNGTTAVVGEPLVKTKFALSHLSLVAYNATNSTAISSYAMASDPDPIYDRFGLKRAGTSAPWVYNHGSNSIMTLSQVAAAGREPDCAELLKAAIVAGSLAKGGPNLPGGDSQYQYSIDTALDYNILQIMANLIDQADTDSYPTQIEIEDSNSVMHLFSGVEDLPYFYRYHLFVVLDRKPNPFLTQSQSGHYTGPLVDAGEAAYMYLPDIWNPYDPNTTATSSGNRPSQFQVVATTQDPLGLTPAWSVGCTTANATGPTFASTPAPLTAANSTLTFSDANGTLFREPTLLWKPGYPSGSGLSGLGVDTVTDANNAGRTYVGIVAGRIPAEMSDGTNLWQISGNLWGVSNVPAGAYPQITFALYYKDANGNWIPYDVKYPDLHGMNPPQVVVNPADYPNGSWQSPLGNAQLSDHATGMDPRTARFGVGTESSLGESALFQASGGAVYTFEPTVSAHLYDYSSAGFAAVGSSNFSVFESQRPRADIGDQVNYSNPGMTSDPGQNANMRWFSGVGYSASNGQNSSPLEWVGLFSQNNPSISFPARSTGTAQLYYEDADGIARRTMAAYADTTLTDSTQNRVGMPMAQASSYASDNGVGTATSQSQSRPIMLNRPFRSVMEMSYAFRGTPWKNIDFFTPESGDSPLLDVFCLNEPPANAMVAGKVDLNTRQAPVIQAIVSGAYRDELSNLSSPPSYALPPLTSAEAANVAQKLVGITTDTTDGWRGPLPNISGITGHYVNNPGTVGSATDQYTFNETITNKSYTYAGLSAALDSTVYTAEPNTAPLIQRFREAALRPLADMGQTRVWNLLIDIVAQTGRYPKSATAMNQFSVEGEKRVWLHVAIDRMTGQVIDSQVEPVTQ